MRRHMGQYRILVYLLTDEYSFTSTSLERIMQSFKFIRRHLLKKKEFIKLASHTGTFKNI